MPQAEVNSPTPLNISKRGRITIEYTLAAAPWSEMSSMADLTGRSVFRCKYRAAMASSWM
jgi:hypothetical protein